MNGTTPRPNAVTGPKALMAQALRIDGGPCWTYMMNNLRSSNFVQLPDCLPRSIDRKLGYMGGARMVFFYYEPRGEEVVWNDGHSYGFGSGGWLVFGDEIRPLAERFGAGLGSDDGPGEHVLLIDRNTSQAYFAHRADAEAIVAGKNVPPLGRATPVHFRV